MISTASELELYCIYSVIESLSYNNRPEYCLLHSYMVDYMPCIEILYYTSTAHCNHYYSNTTFSEACVNLIWKSQMLWRNSDFPWVKRSNICIWLFTSTTAFDLNGGDSGIYCIFSSQLKYHADSPSKIKKETFQSLPQSFYGKFSAHCHGHGEDNAMIAAVLPVKRQCMWRGTMIICNGTADSEPSGNHCALN